MTPGSTESSGATRRALLAFWLLAVAGVPGTASGQLGQLVSPGPLSKAHAKIEGLANCEKCHEKGKQVSPARCLDCHKPVAERIAAKKGVHRDAGGGCVKCHIEHGGRDTDLRHFDEKAFDHAREAGYPLDGKHAVVAAQCARCHKTRSFLTVKPDCAGCHADPHQGKLGAACATCHALTIGFKETMTRFDHSKAAFALDGAHRVVPCLKCHQGKMWKGIRFQLCTDCHKNPHKESMGTDCRACHTVQTWKVQKFDHAKTGTPLLGRHLEVPCAKCHVKPATQVRLRPGPCASCHKDPHKGEFKQPCASCHNENGWKKAPFDHSKTRFPLDGRHSTLPCTSCHKAKAKPAPAAAAQGLGRPLAEDNWPNGPPALTAWGEGAPGVAFAVSHRTAAEAPRAVPAAARKATPGRAAGKGGKKAPADDADFRGLTPECASCHADPHKGTLSSTCQKCHTSKTWKVTTFRHERFPGFFGGLHAPVACASCHRDGANGQTASEKDKIPPAATRIYKDLPTDCSTCHKDVHLGQLGKACETCHTVDAAKFKAPLFRHDRSSFPLTGKHLTTDCQKCHRQETGAFPAGQGTAVRYRGAGAACATCHKDVHLGQVGQACESCHGTTEFAVRKFVHKQPAPFFFGGLHAAVKCEGCHRKVEADFPAGHGITVRLTGLPSQCSTCHKDPHQETLGPNCQGCHSVDSAWVTASRAFHKSGVFPLEGRHLAVPCASCHVDGVLKGTPTTCFECHWIRRQDDKYRTRLGNQCESCHRPTSWSQVQWDHASRTGFPLNPSHMNLACDQCHKNQVFTGTPADCASCHMKDFNRAKNPDHVAGGFPTACQNCHRPSDASWNQARFDHSTFPLLGVHGTRACADCHTNNNYKTTPTTCSGCHLSLYNATKTPPHAASGFATTCDTCHKFTDPDWLQARYTHKSFQLVGVHATQTCTACHNNGVWTGTSTLCASCHQSLYDKTTTPPHAVVHFPTTCDTCHKATDATWNQGTFSHSTFPLAGVHSTRACADCHTNKNYTTIPTTCVGCHLPLYNATKTPPHAPNGIGTTCDTCHKYTDPDWLQARYTHKTFQLVGVHATQACTACHGGGVWTGTPTLCSACHQALYDKTTNPPHAAAHFPTTCDTCHKATDATWNQAVFDHSRFPLAGVHSTRACLDCHVNNNYTTVPTTCSGCHLALYNATKTPPHAASGFATTCDTCHKYTDPDWLQARYTHKSFQLVGVHATQPCTACHGGGVWAGTPTLCAGCHQALYDKTTNPPHAASHFPTTCDTCHKATDPNWLLAVFSHTTFPLVGVHATLACTTCHTNNNYTTVPTLCSGCHLALYNATKTPPHAASGFATTCDTCHKPTDPDWLQARYTHKAFQLVGVHATQTCTACHSSGVWAGTSTLCASCHQALYDKTTNPPHAASHFPTTCDTCHKATDPNWLLAVFSHTTFPLVGVHATLACTTCHTNNNYTTVPTLCSGCHLALYNATTNPPHAASHFPTTCDTCHKATDPNWLQAVFSHTTFPLVGVHATLACTTCHTNNNYTTVPTLCSGCHLALYNATKTPPHAASGFATTCDSCHKPTDPDWLQAKYTHKTFQLVGVHATQTCTACHNSGVWAGTSTLCSSCHLALYNATTNPNHVAAGFPTTCDQCHKATDASWNLGVFNHTQFPIASGRHSGIPCATCHTTPTNFALFSCTTSCHAKAQTDSNHNGVSGYRYDSAACYACHPQGRAG